MCSKGCVYAMNILHSFLHKQGMLSIIQVALHTSSLASTKIFCGRSISTQKYIGVIFFTLILFILYCWIYSNGIYLLWKSKIFKVFSAM